MIIIIVIIIIINLLLIYIAQITCAYDQMRMTYESILTNKKLYD